MRPDGLWRYINMLFCSTKRRCFVSVQTNWLLTCAGLHSYDSLRDISKNQFTGSIDALGKLTGLQRVCVFLMGYRDVSTPLHILLSLDETHIWIYCLRANILTANMRGFTSHNSLRGLYANQFTGNIHALGKLTKLLSLCVRMG